jgi:glycerol-3-phosphate dehydrogenase
VTRAETILEAQTTTYDLCVIGGGATGAGCALDAQLRGLRTILIEAADFASKTSSASTKMAHGGIRYLQAAVAHLDWRQFRLVDHALHERALMLRNAPHLARPIEFLTPCFTRAEQLYYGAGMKLYQWIAGRASLAPSRLVSREEALARVPAMTRAGLAGAASYADGQFDDARYCLALVLTFVQAGGAALNYMRATGFDKDSCGRIRAVEVEQGFAIRARAFVNATGPYSDAVRRMASESAAPRLRPSKGVHAMFPLGSGWRADGLLAPKTEDGRVVFAIPYHGRLMVGTTDDEASPETGLVVLRREVEYLVRQINPYLHMPLSADQMVSGFAGIRPLVGSGGKTSALVRDDEVEADPRTGLISILGGKWTTYRRMAEKTIDEVQRSLGLPPGGCVTRGTRLVSAPRAHSFRAQVRHAVRHELALTLEDVLARRMGLELWDWRTAARAARVTAHLMARELGWPRSETEAAADRYAARIRRFRQCAELDSRPS